MKHTVPRKHRRLPRPPLPDPEPNEIRIITSRNKRLNPKTQVDHVADAVALFEVKRLFFVIEIFFFDS